MNPAHVVLLVCLELAVAYCLASWMVGGDF